MEISEKQLQELLTKAIATAVSSAIMESRKPTDAEMAKLAKEEADTKRRMEEMLIVAKAEEESKRLQWANCNHKKEDGRPSIGGQIHSDGLVHPLCLHCQFEFPPYKPTQEMLAQGIQ